MDVVLLVFYVVTKIVFYDADEPEKHGHVKKMAFP